MIVVCVCECLYDHVLCVQVETAKIVTMFVKHMICVQAHDVCVSVCVHARLHYYVLLYVCV